MGASSTTYVYTTQGRQRPIFLPEAATTRFVLSVLKGDAGTVQTSCDPPATLRRQAGVWEDYTGGLEGAVAHITALRVVLHKNTGWAKLIIQQERIADGTD